MFDLDPGPLDRLDPGSAPRLQLRPSFLSIVVDGLAPSDGLQTVLSQRQLDVTDNPPVDLDAVHAATIGLATDIVTGQIATAPDSPIPGILDTGESANTLREQQRPFLPPPETPIDAPFLDPPPKPGPNLPGHRPPPPEV